MKAKARMVEGTEVDGEQLRIVHNFLNMTYDAYVHGAYETTMELFDQATGVFAMRGHPDKAKREEFVENVFLKLHEVVVAIELTAAVTAHADVFSAARTARHTMDASEPWKLASVEGLA
jgi:methionyl-tRNA synthetase